MTRPIAKLSTKAPDPEASRPEHVLFRGARVITPVAQLGSSGPRRGGALGRLDVHDPADVLIAGDRIAWIGPSGGAPSLGHTSCLEFDAGGSVLMPAFVDCHTHACWAGDRLDEWEQKLRGVPYLEILQRGGGIMSTVRAVRRASIEELAGDLRDRLVRFLRAGTTTVEVKSGYGLNTDGELKMLRAIRDAGESWHGTVVGTGLLGHAIDKDHPEGEAGFVRGCLDQTLYEVHREFPGIAIDAFCERSAWSFDDSFRLLRRAKEIGHPIRVHADQFNSLGMTPAAVALGAASVDHLEASSVADLELLARSTTIGVGLPLCGMHLDGRFADLRRLAALGGAVAIATNCNPGSAPSVSMPAAIWAAVRHCGLSWQQAIVASTVNAAAVLGFSDRGFIAPGARADLVLLDSADERTLAYEIGGDPVRVVVVGGRVIEKF